MNIYLVSTVDTDGLVLKHQGISSCSAEYTSMHFQLFMGKDLKKLFIAISNIWFKFIE